MPFEGLGERVGREEPFAELELGGEVAVGTGPVHVRPEQVEQGARRLGRSERSSQVDGAGWCELALLDDRVQAGVALAVEDGRFTSIEAAVPAPPDAIRLPGLTTPGLANAHSHAFHRALRGRTQTGSGSFWTWRDTMYQAAERLDPDRYHRLARATFAEMALAGITVVGEFHYYRSASGDDVRSRRQPRSPAQGRASRVHRGPER